jgi:hypothetical protein
MQIRHTLTKYRVMDIRPFVGRCRVLEQHFPEVGSAASQGVLRGADGRGLDVIHINCYERPHCIKNVIEEVRHGCHFEPVVVIL